MPELNEILKYATIGIGIAAIIISIITMTMTSEIGKDISLMILISIYFLIVVPTIN